MKKYLKTIFVLIFVISFSFQSIKVQAATISDYTVLLSRMKTAVGANQEIKFVTPSGVSSGDTVTITWSNEFVMNSFDYEDVDFAEGDSASCSTAVFSDETLVAGAPNANEFSATLSSYTLTLTSGGASATVAPGVCVRIIIGTDAIFGSVGDTQITNALNPDDDDSVTIGGTFGDTGLQFLDIITGDQVSISATVGSVAPPGGGGGGGSGGGSGSFQASVIFSGRAYPLSSVTLLRDGVVVSTTVSGPDAKFTISLYGVPTGNHTFTVYSTDSAGRRSNPFNVTLYISSGVSTTVSGIFLTPTIAVDKPVVRRGENLTVFGTSTPTSDIVIEVNSENQLFFSTRSDNDGVYLFTFDTSPLELGDHGTKSKSRIGTEISEYSKVAGFKVGNQTILTQPTCGVIADLNLDCRVNLVDYSILAYWYKRALPPRNVDLNHDSIVSIADFSIMAYYWTG